MYRNRKYRGRLSSVAETQQAAANRSAAAAAASVSVVSVSSASVSGKENDGGQKVVAKIHRPMPSYHEDDELFAIPASQITTQSRYISQRSMLCRTTQQTSQLGSSHRLARNYFEKVLQKCSVNFECPECFVLDIDHITFVSKLRQTLRSDANFPGSVKDFLGGLTDEMRDPATLAKLMSGCKVELPQCDTPKLTQESLMQDFLMLDFIQDDLKVLLFGKLRTFALEEDGASLSIVQLLLSQLMLIDQQKHGEAVFKQIFEILSVASSPAKRLIITSLEDIVDITLHDRTVGKILEIFPNDADLLTAANVETFGNLCLNGANRRELRRRIVSHMRNNSTTIDIHLYPVYVQFLLQLNVDETDALPQVLADLRQTLRWPGASAANRGQINASQRAVFDRIVSALIQSRKLFDTWLRVLHTAVDVALDGDGDEDGNDQTNAVNVEAEMGTRSLDLLVLLAMQSINDDKRNYIENIIRRKIKADHLTARHIEYIVLNYADVLQQYDKVLLEMLNAFFRDKHPALSRLASQSYRFLFSIESWDRKLIVSKLVGFVCHDERDSDAVRADSVRTTALIALTTINEAFPAQMQHNGNQLLRILDHTDDLSLPQVRLFMDLLCCVAYPAVATDNVPELREHLDMLVRKQVSSTFDKTRKQGIVGMARVIDHMVWQSGGRNETPIEMDTDATFGSIDDIPDVVAQEAARYVDLIRCVTRRCTSSLALCYDELAAIVLRRGHRNTTGPADTARTANKHFIAWLCDLITEDFQEFFVTVELPPADASPIPLEYQFCINALEDNEGPTSGVEKIAINVAGGVVTAAANGGTPAVASIVCLTSLFHLMRSLHLHRNAGDLEPINAVLGCAIIVPQCVRRADTLNVAEEFGAVSAAQVLDMLVYTVNWLRETIGAFVSQDSAMIRRKVLLRVSKLVELERLVRAQLRNAPAAYQMPTSQFALRPVETPKLEFKRPADPPASRKATKRKTPKDTAGAAAEDSVADMTLRTALQSAAIPGATQTATGGDDDKTDKRTVYGARETYRHLDPDVMLLLREDLLTEMQLSEQLQGTAMGLVEFEFVLADLVAKVETIVGTATRTKSTTNGDAAGHWQSIIGAGDLISDVLQFLPRLVAAWKKLSAHLAQTIEQAAEDATLKYTPQANYTKACMAHLLRLLAAIYAWPEFEKQENATMLADSLKVLRDCGRVTDESATESAVVGAVRAIVTHEAVIVDLATAVHMVRLVEALSKFDRTKNNHQHLVLLCKQFLSRRWFGADGLAERGARCNALLDELARGLFVRVKLSSLQLVAANVLSDVKRFNAKNSVLSKFPTITKANFPLLFRNMCAALLDTLQRRIAKNGPSIAHLKLWEEACSVIDDLLACIEAISIPRNFAIFLKYAHQFVRTFLQHGLPMLEQCFRTHAPRVREIIRCLQNTTRFLHRLCCHSKSIQNAAIVAQIPLLRETVEALLVRVKALLVAHKCCTTDIWEIGSLKNKDLQGHVLIQEEDEAGDEDSIIPERMDEEEDDVDLHDREETTTNTTKKKRRLRSGEDLDGDATDDGTVSVRSRNSSRSRVF